MLSVRINVLTVLFRYCGDEKILTSHSLPQYGTIFPTMACLLLRNLRDFGLEKVYLWNIPSKEKPEFSVIILLQYGEHGQLYLHQINARQKLPVLTHSTFYIRSGRVLIKSLKVHHLNNPANANLKWDFSHFNKKVSYILFLEILWIYCHICLTYMKSPHCR